MGARGLFVMTVTAACTRVPPARAPESPAPASTPARVIAERPPPAETDRASGEVVGPPPAGYPPAEMRCQPTPEPHVLCNRDGTVVGSFGGAYGLPKIPESASPISARPGGSGKAHGGWRASRRVWWADGWLLVQDLACANCAALMGWTFVGAPAHMSDAQLGTLQQKLSLPVDPPLRTRREWAGALAR